MCIRDRYYTVQVRFAAGQSYKLEKRYRDFDQLNTTLTERFASVLRGGAAMFPPKKPFTKLNPEFYESRVGDLHTFMPVSYTHLRAHETVLDLVCRLLLEKKKKNL
eukprot:TRINITY_DN12638_c0_g3_i3.p1 TRINITY_DN12638_c0_g3~~TRINITY_DN12638_c0_g3_i3.p1  ORF type:complete len:106 (-),score=22.95 TRINITY_DN12638_c0_g3_i3:20-337(-)